MNYSYIKYLSMMTYYQSYWYWSSISAAPEDLIPLLSPWFVSAYLSGNYTDWEGFKAGLQSMTGNSWRDVVESAWMALGGSGSNGWDNNDQLDKLSAVADSIEKFDFSEGSSSSGSGTTTVNLTVENYSNNIEQTPYYTLE